MLKYTPGTSAPRPPIKQIQVICYLHTGSALKLQLHREITREEDMNFATSVVFISWSRYECVPLQTTGLRLMRGAEQS